MSKGNRQTAAGPEGSPLPESSDTSGTVEATGTGAGASTAPEVRPVRHPHLRVAGRSLLLVIAMFGFGYLMVPLYDIICDVTGLNGKTGRLSEAEANARGAASEREITVEFTASVNRSGDWIFRPNQTEMTVNPGKTYHATYYAENLSSRPIVGQATPSVSPFSAAPYFNKTECFCFTRQAFEGAGTEGSSRDMPLTFIIDPDVPINVDRVTLSYTFFRSPDQDT